MSSNSPEPRPSHQAKDMAGTDRITGAATPEATQGTSSAVKNSGQDPASDTGKPTAWWTHTSSSSRIGPSRLPLVRLGWAALVAIVLLITWGSSGPDGVPDWNGELQSASSNASLNNTTAEGAPQQTVVNGWHQIELAEVQVRQSEDLLQRQSQVANMLLVLGMGLAGDLALRALGDRQVALRRQRRADGMLTLEGR